MSVTLLGSSLLVLAVASPPSQAGLPLPTWTDKEVLIAVGSVVGALIPVVLFIIQFTMRSARSRIRRLVAEKRILQEQLDNSPPIQPDPALVEAAKKLKEMEQELAKLVKMDAGSSSNAPTQRPLIEQIQGTLKSLKEELQHHEGDLKSERRRIDRALRKDGQTWNERVLANTPEFKPLDPEARRTPIVSVVNLKGGVGKTTITANLAAALDGLGYRVLLLDLDLQGSLTGLFLAEGQQETLFKEERLLEDFLAASFDAEFPNLLDYIQPVLPDGRTGLVPTSDYLAYAEMNLTIRWLLREGNRDVRFLLRKELHLKRVTNKYDVVLIDCPPLINVCCVNALAACDYLIVPVMPSKQATARVPVLLNRLKEFRENINPELKIMGVVANRTSRSDLTADEQNRLSLLRDQCRDIWGEPVAQFETFIRQSAEIRAAEDQNRPLRHDDEMYQGFDELAREFVSRLPMFCQTAGKPEAVVKEVTP